jgi:DNA-binding NarL/FixJ family response regulator
VGFGNTAEALASVIWFHRMKIRVLVADDHAVVAEGLRALIDGQRDMKVAALAENGLVAARRSLELKPDVVVMDHSMPVLNGIEAIHMIRRRRAETRIIILSMHSDMVHVQRALQAGANGYVLKETGAREVLHAIRAVHAGRRYLSGSLTEEFLDHVMSEVPEDPLSPLSARERQVLQMIAEGRAIVEIASALSLSRKTVETYRERMMEKLGVEDFASLIRFAIKQGLVPLE